MSTARFPSGEPTAPLWQVLYQDALLDFDDAKLLTRILRAPNAIRERAQENLPDPFERQVLDDALQTLLRLEEIEEENSPHRMYPLVVPASGGKRPATLGA